MIIAQWRRRQQQIIACAPGKRVIAAHADKAVIALPTVQSIALTIAGQSVIHNVTRGTDGGAKKNDIFQPVAQNVIKPDKDGVHTAARRLGNNIA